MINENAVSAALEKHIAAGALGYQIVWVNDKKDPPLKPPTLIVEVVRTGSTDVTFDGSAQISRGLLKISVLTSLGGFATIPTAIAQAVAALFPFGAVLTEGAVKVTTLSHPDIASGYNDGVYWRTIVTIRYSAISA